MRQAVFLAVGGCLRLGVSDPEPETVTTWISPRQTQSGWMASHLDELSLDNDFPPLPPYPPLPSSSSFLRTHHSPWRRRTTSQSRRRFLGQYELSTKSGKLTIDKEHRHKRVFGDPTSHHSMERPRLSLFALPFEIRQEVYRYLLLTAAEIPLRLIAGRWQLPSNKRNHVYGSEGLWPEILAACSQINKEGSRILYGENRFCLENQLLRGGEDFQKWSRSRPLPVCNPPTATGHMCVTDVRLVFGFSSRPERAFDSEGNLKALEAFPKLKMLRFYVLLVHLKGLNMEGAWLQAMKSVDRQPMPPKRVDCEMGIAIADADYQQWVGSHRMDFSIHRKKKNYFQSLMEAEGLFGDRQLTWIFNIRFTAWMWPGCSVQFIVGDKMTTGRTLEKTEHIICRRTFDDGRIKETVNAE